jgi:bestrophin-3
MITSSSFIIYIYQSGIMTRKEKQCYESVIPVVNLFWVPATWFVSALNEAVSAGTLKNEYGAKLIMEV